MIAAGAAQLMHWRNTHDLNDKGTCDATSWCDHLYATWSIQFGSYLYDLYHDRLDELNDAAFADALEEYIREYGEPPLPPSGAVAP